MQMKSLQFIGKICVVRPPLRSVLLFDVQRKGGRRNQPVTAAAARHHGDAAATVSVEAGTGAGGGCGCGRGGGGLLELLLVDFALFGPAILKPDLHLEMRKKVFLPETFTLKGRTETNVLRFKDAAAGCHRRPLTCRSDRLRAVASSDFLLMVMYLL